MHDVYVEVEFQQSLGNVLTNLTNEGVVLVYVVVLLFLAGEEIYALVTTEGCWCSGGFFSFASLVLLLVSSFLGFPQLFSSFILLCDRLSVLHYLVGCELVI